MSRRLFDVVAAHVAALEGCSTRVTRSQVAFRRKRNFALVWMPGRYLGREAAPLVLVVLLRSRIRSPRWKQVVEPAPNRFTHHLELHGAAEIDAEVDGWLRAAWQEAG